MFDSVRDVHDVRGRLHGDYGRVHGDHGRVHGDHAHGDHGDHGRDPHQHEDRGRDRVLPAAHFSHQNFHLLRGSI